MFEIFQVFPDVFTKRELNGLHLHCANPGCSWQSTYEKLEVSWLVHGGYLEVRILEIGGGMRELLKNKLGIIGIMAYKHCMIFYI